MSSVFLIDKRMDSEISSQIEARFPVAEASVSAAKAAQPLIQSLSRLTQMLGSKTNSLTEKYFRYIVDQLGYSQTVPATAEAPVVFTLAKNVDQVVLAKATALTSSAEPKIYFETNEELIVRNNSLSSVVVDNYISSRQVMTNAIEGQICSDIELNLSVDAANLQYIKKIEIADEFSSTDQVFIEIANLITKDCKITLDNNELVGKAQTELDCNSNLLSRIKSYCGGSSQYLPVAVEEGKSLNLKFETTGNLVEESINQVDFGQVKLIQFSTPDRILVDGKTILTGADAKHFVLNSTHENVIYYACKKVLSQKNSSCQISIDLKIFLEGYDETAAVFKTHDVTANLDKVFKVNQVEFYNGILWEKIETASGSFDGASKQFNIKIKSCPEVELTKINGIESRWIRFGVSSTSETDLIEKLKKDFYTTKNELSGYKSVSLGATLTNVLALKYRTDLEQVQQCSFGSYDPDGTNFTSQQNKIVLNFNISSLCAERVVDWYFIMNPQVLDRNSNCQLSLLWQYQTATGWKTIDDVSDGTLNFSKSGRVLFTLNSECEKNATDGFYRVRCVIDKSEKTDNSTYLKIISDLNFSGIYHNYVTALGQKTSDKDLTYSSSGAAGQSFSLGEGGIISFEVEVTEPAVHNIEEDALIASSQKNIWTRVANFLNSVAQDRVYVVDYANNQILFGDGINGCVPPAGDKNVVIKNSVRIVSSSALVEVNAINKLYKKNSSIKACTNIGKATGYREIPTEDEYYSLVPVRLKHNNRAVTNSDIEQMIYEVFSEVYSCKCFFDESLEKIKVVVVPTSLQDLQGNDVLLTRVRDYLLTCSISDKIICVYPSLVDIQIKIEHTKSALPADELKEQITLALNTFFDPSLGGQNKKGWPVGRHVYKSEIYWALQNCLGNNLYRMTTTPNLMRNSYISMGAWEYPNITKIELIEVSEQEQVNGV